MLRPKLRRGRRSPEQERRATAAPDTIIALRYDADDSPLEDETDASKFITDEAAT
jgi:hypothetical protein